MMADFHNGDSLFSLGAPSSSLAMEPEAPVSLDFKVFFYIAKQRQSEVITRYHRYKDAEQTLGAPRKSKRKKHHLCF